MLPKLLLLLLCIGISAAYPTQQVSADIASDNQRSFNGVEFLPPLSILESAPHLLLARQDTRQDTRSEEFMRNAIKGAQTWEKYQSTLSGGQSGSSVKVPLVSDDDHTGIGWKEDSKGNEFPIAVKNKAGWRYWKTKVSLTEELKSVFHLVLPEVDNIQLHQVHSMEWADPRFELIASFDCKNGIAVSSYSNFLVNTIRSQYRWSDVMWGLWSAMCPNHQRNLRYIVRDFIVNDKSTLIMREAATAAGHYSTADLTSNDEQVTTLTPPLRTQSQSRIDKKSCNAAQGDCDFYAMIHTPNVIGALYLAMGHAHELAFDSIKKISAISFYIHEDKEEDEDEDEDEDTNTESEEKGHIAWYSVIELGAFSS